MPLTIRLQTENGHLLKQIGDLDDALVRLALREGSRLRIAHTIDPYGDTYCNYLQIPLLLDDLRTILAGGASLKEAEIIGEIEALAHEARSEPHLYLVFVGD